uniref:calcium/calmodulin-dependent 3',5'-cyclic nucleotide phosphodiesterase 1C-like isoform X2 n=1 Tax=Gasterosteus aculeatus aculeatus TaxID=481459 RepID=UPI001A99FDD7|nr:calcium/calmodulin-dependent 3',5'-cyclic nucleotide phosphodiesterase 1C-like isoform X2 [Gasterosteus aculeatus aculeatus]
MSPHCTRWTRRVSTVCVPSTALSLDNRSHAYWTQMTSKNVKGQKFSFFCPVANEAAPSSRFPPAHLARSRSQNALRTAVPAAVGITEYKGVQNEEILKDELPVLGAPDTMEKTASRSRCLVKQLERGEASVVELKRNLDYAASVLEALCIEEAS